MSASRDKIFVFLRAWLDIVLLKRTASGKAVNPSTDARVIAG